MLLYSAMFAEFTANSSNTLASLKPKLMKFHLALLPVVALSFSSCMNEPVHIADNTFLYKSKVYAMIDNELVELADVNADKVRKFQVTKPQRRSLGESSIDFVKENATVQVEALYRGNILYFKAEWKGIDDMRDNYYPGSYTIDFVDEYGFILHSVNIPTSELVARVNSDREVTGFEFNGKTEMSTDINAAIKGFDVNSSVKRK